MGFQQPEIRYKKVRQRTDQMIRQRTDQMIKNQQLQKELQGDTKEKEGSQAQ